MEFSPTNETPVSVPVLGRTIPKEFICPITGQLFREPVRATDGITYVKAALEKWFDFHPSLSPSTGMEMDESTEQDEALLTRIANWTSYAAEEPRVGAPKRRRLNDHSADTVLWNVRFAHGYDQWSVSISPSQSLTTLYEIAFRKLNTKSPTNKAHIRLYSNTNILITSDDANLISSLLQPNCLITIELPPITPSPGLWFPDFRSSCLIKVYASADDEPIFSYWESITTLSRAFSILFRYYRFAAEVTYDSVRPALFSHLNIYTSEKDVEDCILMLKEVPLWRPLRDIIYRCATVGSLGDDPFIVRPSNRADFGDRVSRVLKVCLGTKNRSLSLESGVTPIMYPSKSTCTKSDGVKVIFEALINRTMAYGLRHDLGLICFSSTPRIVQPLTNVLEDFRDSLRNVRCSGFTSLWDSLWIAHRVIMERAALYPEARRRILCLTDGEDKLSKTSARGLFSTSAR